MCEHTLASMCSMKLDWCVFLMQNVWVRNVFLLWCKTLPGNLQYTQSIRNLKLLMSPGPSFRLAVPFLKGSCGHLNQQNIISRPSLRNITCQRVVDLALVVLFELRVFGSITSGDVPGRSVGDVPGLVWSASLICSNRLLKMV